MKNTSQAPSAVRMRRRNRILDILASRFAGTDLKDSLRNGMDSWDKFSSLFTNAAFPKSANLEDLSDATIKKKVSEILSTSLKNFRSSSDGITDDIVKAIEEMPRRKKTARKIKEE